MNKLLFTPIKQVSQKLNKGEVRPSEICKAAVDLASAVKPLNAFITLTTDLAENQAIASDQRHKDKKSLGNLDGIPIAIKDNFCTSGQPTTCASLMLSNFVPQYDATVYSRLKDSGAILVGKTNLDQFAMGSGTVDSFYGPTKNLWGSQVMDDHFSTEDGTRLGTELRNGKDNWYIAGGSSGGSAVAVATGSCYAALGSDTGGSTRNPASYCGLVGLKPSYGLVSRHGLIPLVNSMDVPGIITRTVDDAVLILNAIAGPDSSDSTTLKRDYQPFDLPESVNLEGLRIGIPKEYRPPGLSEEVDDCWREVGRLLEEGGAAVVPVSLPHTDFSIVCYSVLNQCEVASNMARYDGLEYGVRAEQSSSTEQLYAETRRLGFNDVVRSRILAGNYFLLSENYEKYFVRAMRLRRLISRDFDEVWDSGVDLLLTPTTLSDAPVYGEFVAADNQTQCSVQDFCTQSANMAGVPAVNVPVKISRRGLPLSVQVMAPFLQERRMLGVAKWIERTVKFPRPVLKEGGLVG